MGTSQKSLLSQPHVPLMHQDEYVAHTFYSAQHILLSSVLLLLCHDCTSLRLAVAAIRLFLEMWVLLIWVQYSSSDSDLDLSFAVPCVGVLFVSFSASLQRECWMDGHSFALYPKTQRM